MVIFPSLPVPFKLTVNAIDQNYGVPESELYMVDLGDGYIARAVMVYGFSEANNNSVAQNGYRLLTIRMSDGYIVAESYSYIQPLVFDGKAFLITKGNTVLNLTRQDYTGNGVWTTTSVPTTNTDFGYRNLDFKFQLTSPTKIVLINLTNYDGQMIEIPDFDITRAVFGPINPVISAGFFQECSDIGIICVTTYIPGYLRDVSYSFYNASDYTRVAGTGDFPVASSYVQKQSYSPVGPTSNPDAYYFIQGKTSADRARFQDNLEFSLCYFPHTPAPGSVNTNVSLFSSLPGANPIEFIEQNAHPATGRSSYILSDFARSGTKFYAGIQYLTGDNALCLGIVTIDLETNVATVRSLDYVNNDSFTPVQIFVDDSGAVFTRIITAGSGTRSSLIRLKDGVIEKLDFQTNLVLAVGTDKLYSYHKELPVNLNWATFDGTYNTPAHSYVQDVDMVEYNIMPIADLNYSGQFALVTPLDSFVGISSPDSTTRWSK